MSIIINSIKKNKTFVFSLFVFSLILTLKNKLSLASSWKDFVFHTDAPFWLFLYALFIFFLINFIKERIERKQAQKIPTQLKYIRYFGIGLIGYLFLSNILGLSVSLAFGNISRNYGSSYQITYKVFNQIIDFIIFAGITLAYLYAKENRNYKKRLNDFEISDAKSKIQQLQSQLNPHFLFNNLNILDQLIEEDKEKASSFLAKFSELYRYTLKNSNKELISIQEELEFAQNYFYLMEEKYKGYYQLIVKNSTQTSKVIVPPFCLQVLIENAITHNLGTIEKPVIINVSFENKIKVTNNKVKLNRKKKGNGVALKNLSKQFELLANKTIDIDETAENFTVYLPLIKTHQK
ncbi:sensor histidine kinase [Tenacibaculum crassostreae]|uniref:sensor histidine kinase n=1 Tax=Tenacibaculum crassostreae TaxID=502683 RepID=UPI00389537DD